MKIIVRILIILIALNMLTMRRSKSKIKNRSNVHLNSKAIPNYSNSQLDICMRIISQNLCKKMGRQATYSFLGNIENWIDGTLRDTDLYEFIFGDTFRKGISEGKIDPQTIQQSINYGVWATLGGNIEFEGNLYWAQYSKKMAQQNVLYLKGLLAGAKGKSVQQAINPTFQGPKRGFFEKIKQSLTQNYGNILDIADYDMNNGAQATAANYGGGLTNGQGGLDAAGMVIISKATSTILDAINYLIQRYMLQRAESNVFNPQQQEEIQGFMDRTEMPTTHGFNWKLFYPSEASCGKYIPVTEVASPEFAYFPSFDGNWDYVNRKMDFRPGMKKRKYKKMK